jgi:hypothetical protein
MQTGASVCEWMMVAETLEAYPGHYLERESGALMARWDLAQLAIG